MLWPSSATCPAVSSTFLYHFIISALVFASSIRPMCSKKLITFDCCPALLPKPGHITNGSNKITLANMAIPTIMIIL